MSCRIQGPVFAFLAALAAGGCGDSTVLVAEVASVELSPDQATLVEGGAISISATMRERGGRTLQNRDLIWSSDDPEVADVSAEGRVEGNSEGRTRIRAAAEGAEGVADVEVIRGPPPPRLAVDPDSVAFSALAGQSEPESQTVRIENVGGGVLEPIETAVRYPDGSSVEWLSAELDRPLAPAELTLRASAALLPPGTYRAVVEVASPAAENGTQEVDVVFTVHLLGSAAGPHPTGKIQLAHAVNTVLR